MKKLLSILLTFVMVFSMTSIVAFADEPEGKITISNPTQGTEYNIYRIFDVQSHSDNYDSIAYRVSEKWLKSGFFNEGSEALNYVTIDANNAVTKKAAFTQETAPAFAKLAIEYAKNPENGITPDNGTTDNSAIEATGSADVIFDKLPLGYYLVDTSVGAFCGLTTTQPTATIQPKNVAPTMEKQVEEDSTGGFGTTNTADLGQIVNFKVTIRAQAGAQNYIYHDKMGEGLTLDNSSVKVQFHKSGATDLVDWQEGQDKDFIIHSDCADGCTFGVELNQEADEGLTTGDIIYITYSAVLNEKATSEGVENTGSLSYGDKHVTVDSTTKTYCYSFDIVKTDAANPPTMLDGAEFELYEEQGDATPILFYMENEKEYRRATAEEINGNDPKVTKTIKVKLSGGKSVANIRGLDNDDYYLKETKNPDGYNAMVGFKEIIINDKDNRAVFNGDAYSQNTGVQVVNSKGAVLPTTGSMGTTAFVAFGSIVALATGVLLVTKKRMSMIDD